MDDYDYKTASAILGTTTTNILTAPINYYAEITSIRYSNPGTVATEVYLTETISGSVVATIDAESVPAGQSLPVMASNERVVGRLDSGYTLSGYTSAGSIIATITYRFKPGRS